MEQPGEWPISSSEQDLTPDYLIGGAARVVLACISSGGVTDYQVAPLFKGVHDALIDIARSSTAVSGHLENVERGILPPYEPRTQAQSPIDVADLAAVIRDMGTSFAAVRLVDGKEARDPEFEPTETAVILPPQSDEIEVTAAAEVETATEASVPEAVSEPEALHLEPDAVLPEIDTVLPETEVLPVQAEAPAAAEQVQAPKVVAPGRTKGKRPAAVRQEAFAFEEAPSAVPPEVQPRQRRKPSANAAALGKVKAKVKGKKLPKGISSVEEALRMTGIVCLEDGRRVKDLAAHLVQIGMSEAAYRNKWNLPDEYPMKAPSVILSRGHTYEVDFATGLFRAVRH